MITILHKQFSTYQIGVLLPLLLLFMGGCDWEPDRNNPLDPASSHYRPINGNLSVRVMTLISDQPIADATVELMIDPVLSKQTGLDGWAKFSSVPVGSLMVRVSADTDREVVYAPSSRLESVTTSDTTKMTFFLDALPRFVSATAQSVTTVEEEGDPPELLYWVHLKARVEDPDGQFDLQKVEWTWEDTLTDRLLNGEMLYRRDSLYFDTLIPGDTFDNIDYSLDWPFIFEAYDDQGYSTRSDPIRLVRVIHDVPIGDPADVKTLESHPVLRWNFSYYDEFVSPRQYNFRVKIFEADINHTMVYDTLLAPDGNFSNKNHQVVAALTLRQNAPNEFYDWFVWVVDLHGNTTRSAPMTIKPTTP